MFYYSVLEMERCDSPIDVAFVLDSSGSISKGNYQKQKDFVKALAQSLDITPNHNHAAIVLFSYDAEIKARLSDHRNTKDFQTAVQQLPHIRGTTRIDLALMKTLEIFSQSRSDVSKVAIVLTDGTLTGGGNADDLRKAAEDLWAKGVRVISIGIGKQVDQEQLRAMTQSEADVTTPNDFDELKLNLRSIVENVCGKTPLS